jgi:hypothetical protein
MLMDALVPTVKSFALQAQAAVDQVVLELFGLQKLAPQQVRWVTTATCI